MNKAWIVMLASLAVIWGIATVAYFKLLKSTRKQRDLPAPGGNDERP